jgi:hypothetical protein
MIKHCSLAFLLLIGLFICCAPIESETNIKIDWAQLAKAWQAYHDYPSSNNAAQVARLLPEIYINDKNIVLDGKVFNTIYSGLMVLHYQILASDQNAVDLGFGLLGISDGAFTEELLWDLSSLIRINPKLFLAELQAHKKTKAIELLGLVVDRFAPYYHGETQARALERELRVKALETVTDNKLIKIRDKCIAVLNSLYLPITESPIPICGLDSFAQSECEHEIEEIRQPFVVRTIIGKIFNAIDYDGWGKDFRVLFEIRRSGGDVKAQKTYADKNGNFVMSDIPEGQYCFKATFCGWKTVMGIIIVSKKADPKHRVIFEMRLD